MSFQRLLFSNKKILQAKNILIFRTGSVGDSICALPAINSICKNFPTAKIDLLTNTGAENLVSLGALIDKSIVSEIINYFHLEKKILRERLKEKKYNLFIQLPQYDAGLIRQTRDIFIAKSLGVKFAFGWQVASTRFLAKQQSRLINFENERNRLLNILTSNGLKNYGVKFNLGITDEVKIKIKSLIEDKRLNEKDENLGMVVGAKRPQNRWPIEYFNEVAKYLLDNGKNILLFGGKEDLELSKRIGGEKVFNYCGELTPLETAELMKYCKIIISNDTGPMHLAYAIDSRVIAIFSSRDYAGKWFPPKNNTTLRNDGELCVNCFDECMFENDCLKKINPKIVIEALMQSLKR